MISLDDLNRYQDILKEIEQLSADISTVVTSLATTGRPSVGGHGSTPGDPTARKAIRITDLKQQRHEQTNNSVLKILYKQAGFLLKGIDDTLPPKIYIVIAVRALHDAGC